MALTSEIQDYDPLWAIRFKQERVQIFERLGDYVEEIHHVGSTSVRGLMAKPEIDLLVIVCKRSSWTPTRDLAGVI